MVFRTDLSWEFNSEENIRNISIKAMRNHFKHCMETSPWYQSKFKHINPEDINSQEAIAQLPLTDKTTLVDNIEDFYGAPSEQMVETVVTSGSTGKPLIFKMTKNDLDRLAFNEAISLHATGINNTDKAQLLISLDRLFIAGMAYYRGLTTLGVDTTRVGVLPFDMQMHYLGILKPTVLVGVPSFLKKFGTQLQNAGFNPEDSTVQKIICIGESLRQEDLSLNSIGLSLEKLFGAKVYNTYATTELSVAYCECSKRNGGHARPELVYTEIVDEEGRPVADGEIGELVATPFGVEGVPLIRYRTGDITFKIPGVCSCGRNSMRIGPILARKSQMMKIRGTSTYPLTLTNALDELDYVRDYIFILEGDETLADNVSLYVAATPARIQEISEHLRACARVSVPILISNENTINSYRNGSRKKIRILDKRVRWK